MREFRLKGPLLKLSPPLLVITLVFVLSAVFIPKSATGSKPAQYVGMETCEACHETIVSSFKDSVHGKKGFALRSERACEACHGPAAAHVEADGDKTKIKSVAALSSEEKSKMCLQCHERGEKTHWAGSAHDSRGLSCTDCHSVHRPRSESFQLNAERESELCFSCHKKQASQFYRASHHPIREGKMTCSDCHNPHGTNTPKSVSADSVPENCYQCHAEKRGPFLWEHIPVREDCMTCHEPHGTNHLKMLNAKPPFLCQRCHSDVRHPGTLYDQTQINSNRLFNRSCTNCHSTIHGSNHPSGKTFLR